MSFLGKFPLEAGKLRGLAGSLAGRREETAGSERAQRFLDPKVLARIANLQLVAKIVVEGFLTGLHRSPQPGVSIDFREYRPYSPGDDPREIDWNVYARSDRYYLKKYHGETNTQVHLVVDASASMSYRSQNGHPGGLSKFEYACFLAASLAHFAIHQRDASGLILFDSEIRDLVPARSREGQLLRILHALDRAQPGKGTDLVAALKAVRGFLQRRGLVILISDFYETPERVMDAIRELQFGGNDLVLFHVLDPVELYFPLDSTVLLEDLETQERMEIIPQTMAAQYRKLLQEHILALGRECRSSRIDYQVMDTGRPLDYALFAYLAARQRWR